MSHERRQYFRLRMGVPPIRAVMVSPSGNPEKALEIKKILIVDLSAGGMLCDVGTRLPVGSTLQITLRLREQTRTLEATVLRVGPASPERELPYRIGCQFANLAMADRDALVAYLFSEQASVLRSQRQHWTQQ